MSEPPTTSPAATIPPPVNPQQQLHRKPPGPTASSSTSTAMEREYRKGNWSIDETLILITAKKLDEERRHRARSAPPETTATATARGELRWKWVENYCWSHGCLRSSNQCNDKWDNLLRDYKKVREYESHAAQSEGDTSSSSSSYWNMDKQDRKIRNLPSNMAVEVFRALHEVLQRKYSTQSQSQSQSQSHTTTTAIFMRDPHTTPHSPAPPPPPLLLPPSTSAPLASGNGFVLWSNFEGFEKF